MRRSKVRTAHLLRVGRENLVDELLARRRHHRAMRIVDLVLVLLVDQLADVLIAERHHARDRDVQDDAGRPDVRQTVVVRLHLQRNSGE